MRPASNGEWDAGALAAELSRRIEGEVRFDRGARALYALDASNYRQVPIGVVIPRTVADVVETVKVCRAHKAPVLSRGGGTSLAGQCCNVAVVIDWTKYLNVRLSLDAKEKTARVLPGLVLDDLRQSAVREARLTFGPDPSTHDHCTLGGMLGNNSCGVHALWAGRTVDNVRSLKVLTYDGLELEVGPTSDEERAKIEAAGGRRAELYSGMKALADRYGALIRARYPRIPRRVSGYNLDQLLPEQGFNVARALVGSEGTLVTLLEAELELVPEPGARALAVLGYPSIFEAADAVPRILEHGPIGLEGVDRLLVRYMREKGQHAEARALLPEADSWLFVELAGDDAPQALAKARGLVDALRGRGALASARVFSDPKTMSRIWEIREAGLGATARIPAGERTLETFPGWEDSAVHPEKLGAYLRDFETLLKRFGYEAALYGHFGDGCLHCRIDFDLKTAPGVRAYRRFVEEAADLVVQYGGSLSGEHGDGQSRAELLPKMYGPELVEAMGAFKALWDPEGGMNPGKVVAPHRLDQDLRFGGAYAPPTPKTHFQFPGDQHSFTHAAERCVGVGKCRREQGGTMCPSYKVTREEQHSTRGRAHLLHEMLMGSPVREGWRSEAVKASLDLCLACKGCKSECPVNVDMATYKAEFLSHYYRGRPRPRAGYAFGLIMHTARVAGRAPRLANFFTQTPGLRRAAKAAAGMSPARQIPPFAHAPLVRRVRRRLPENPSGRRVILYPDTFTNRFHPEIGEAALEVLEAAGFRVEVPRRFTCCGRPLYDYGMLGHARRLLERALRDFREEIRDGVPFVVLEPSCAATFRDELPNLMPHDLDAGRLAAQVHTLGELMDRHAPDVPLPRLDARAVLHGHCHEKAVLGFDAGQRLLGRLGVEAEVPDSGCCGMAGSFGFERDKYEVSVAVGEQVLLPRVRQAGADTLIVADGFSCRTQIAQLAGRRALHTAEVVQRALAQRPAAVAPRPKAAQRRLRRGLALGAAGVGALLVGGRVLRTLA